MFWMTFLFFSIPFLSIYCFYYSSQRLHANVFLPLWNAPSATLFFNMTLYLVKYGLIFVLTFSNPFISVIRTLIQNENQAEERCHEYPADHSWALHQKTCCTDKHRAIKTPEASHLQKQKAAQ